MCLYQPPYKGTKFNQLLVTPYPFLKKGKFNTIVGVAQLILNLRNIIV